MPTILPRVSGIDIAQRDADELGCQFIMLPRGNYILIDASDFDSVSIYRWALTSHGYAVRRLPNYGQQVYMHREIMNPPNGMDVDHINKNTLDNRRSNMRLCYRRQNISGKAMSKNNTTGFKGVVRFRSGFMAQIKVSRKHIYLGLFDDPKVAAAAYDNAAMMHFGEFALTNKSLCLL